MRLAVFAVLAASLFASSGAHAELVSSREKPFYIEGAFPLGYQGLFAGGCGRFGCAGFGGGWGAWRPDIELGFHFTGRHDGFVLGFRHIFYVYGSAGMGGALRLGYDIPIPIKDGKYEVTIGPYGYIGAAFYGPAPSAGLQTGGGVEGKFFLIKGFYVFGRPFDLGIQCLHDSGNCYFQYQIGAGAGYAW
jgi:hypothetical protein